MHHLARRTTITPLLSISRVRLPLMSIVAACALALCTVGGGCGDDRTSTPPTQDGGGKKDDGQQKADQGVVPDPDRGAGVCPFYAPVFDCAAACANIWKLVKTCANDPIMPPNLKLLFKTMSSLNQNAAMTACKATCAADSQQFPEQWSCFQGAPNNSCTPVAGCTAYNCPNGK